MRLYEMLLQNGKGQPLCGNNKIISLCLQMPRVVFRLCYSPFPLKKYMFINGYHVYYVTFTLPKSYSLYKKKGLPPPPPPHFNRDILIT